MIGWGKLRPGDQCCPDCGPRRPQSADESAWQAMGHLPPSQGPRHTSCVDRHCPTRDRLAADLASTQMMREPVEQVRYKPAPLGSPYRRKPGAYSRDSTERWPVRQRGRTGQQARRQWHRSVTRATTRHMVISSDAILAGSTECGARKGGRVVECAGFEIRYTGNRIGGSNPPLSARSQGSSRSTPPSQGRSAAGIAMLPSAC